MGGEPFADLRQDTVAVLGLHLVRLGQDDLEGDRGGVEKAHDLFVHRFDSVTRVDQHEGPAERGAAREVGLQQPLPFLHHRDRRLGIAVAGQVDEVVTFAEGEEVDFLRAAGRVGGARQPLAARQGVDQRRFPDIGAAREADLGAVGGGHAVHGDDALQEVRPAREE
jgi:hypothetical protein